MPLALWLWIATMQFVVFVGRALSLPPQGFGIFLAVPACLLVFMLPLGAFVLVAAAISIWKLRERARWLLVLQSYDAGYSPNEQWWKRLARQLNTTSGQDRLEVSIFSFYAYWSWVLMSPFQCL